MEKQATKADPFKGSTLPSSNESHYAQNRLNAITSICLALSSHPDIFDKVNAYEAIKTYRTEYSRWFYSDISNYIFSKKDDDLAVFNNNLGSLQAYAHEQSLATDGHPKAKHALATDIETMIDKFWDHSNLAQRQKTLLSVNDEDFALRFEKHAKPYSDNLARELNKELISLVSIFTALSFIVFGGISSLDNLFEEAGSIPIIELVIVGCIWSFCILNLVFSFVYLVSKLTKLPIRATNKPDATLVQKYPFWVWSNYFLLLIFAVFCWLYYVDYSNSGSWLILFSQEHSILSAIIGCVCIALPFGNIGCQLISTKNEKNRKK